MPSLYPRVRPAARCLTALRSTRAQRAQRGIQRRQSCENCEQGMAGRGAPPVHIWSATPVGLMLFCTDNSDFEIETTSQRSPQGRSQEIQKAPLLNLKRIARCSLEFRGTGVARKYGPGGPPVPPCPKPASSPVPRTPQRKGPRRRSTPRESKVKNQKLRVQKNANPHRRQRFP